MGNYQSTLSFESSLVEGLRYTTTKLSHGRRLKLNEATASIVAKMNEAYDQLQSISAKIDDAVQAAKIAPKSDTPVDQNDPRAWKVSETVILDDGTSSTKDTWYLLEIDPDVLREERRVRIDVIWNELKVGQYFPALIRWGVQKIEGWEIDGQPITVESLLEKVPDDVIVEIGLFIQTSLNMSLEDQMGFKSPGTSNTPESGQMTNTSAVTAGN